MALQITSHPIMIDQKPKSDNPRHFSVPLAYLLRLINRLFILKKYSSSWPLALFNQAKASTSELPPANRKQNQI
ncbi:hypothetical protein L596_022073 [Steinernema carpocapsae]|uniref:Uncharacterized protein n=1 Tax=Steinernema carpocapsae TaxID=34508 RepID=A0A4U5MKQ5_STECR|nr:hypothetical protein L596_022073 [Steinernema carpocapsae]